VLIARPICAASRPKSSKRSSYVPITTPCSPGLVSRLSRPRGLLHQHIAISTPGVSDATCQVAGGDGVHATINTPASVSVPKSRKDIEVTCTAQDRTAATKTIKSTYSDWSIVEYPLGYPIDAVTGAMWVYPKTVAISFRASADGKAEASQ
jgi:hypothetical protein